jgi:hypothetical protein
LQLLRADSRAAQSKEGVLQLLGGVPRDFAMYAPLVRSGGIAPFYDIVTCDVNSRCEVVTFWNEIRAKYRHREFVEQSPREALPAEITGSPMEMAGLGALYMP